jgi:hypothetical protein
MKQTIINELTKGISQLFPEESHIIKNDIEKQIKATLKTTFEKMDLVTREEFDIQQKVLARTRSKIDALEQQLAELIQQNDKG